MKWTAYKDGDRFIVEVDNTTLKSKSPSYISWKFGKITGVKLSFDEKTTNSSNATNTIKEV